MKKLLLFVLALVLIGSALVAASAKAAGPVYGHPIYVWGGDVLMDVLYQPHVGYDYSEIEAAFYAISTTSCGQPGQRECWYGHHVGALKNVKVNPPVVAGFYYNEWNGKYYLIDTGQCLLKDGCLAK